jgi:hypothetical protein
LYAFLISPMRAACPFIILYLVILIIFGEEYTLRISLPWTLNESRDRIHFASGLGPTNFLSTGCQGFLPSWAKRSGRVYDHSTPSTAEAMNRWSYTSTPPTSSWCGA